MAIDWATVDVNILPSDIVALAANGVSAALQAQGYRVALTRDNQTMTFTNDSTTVAFAGGDAGDAGEQLVDEQTKRCYRISSFAGGNYTLAENYVGTTGAKRAHVFPGAAAGANPVQPRNGGIWGAVQ